VKRLDLSVVVPAYREGRHIRSNIDRLLTELDRLGCDYEVIVVSDGNSDDTAAEAARTGSPRVKVIEYAINMGKGYALGRGVAKAAGELVTFIDADMELDPRAIGAFIHLIREENGDIVVGSKRHPGSRVHYPAFRRVQSFLYQVLIMLLFDLRVRETQTGLKLFRREVLANVVPLLAVKRFAFDLELLVVATHIGYRRIVEGPIELTYRFQSTISPTAVFQILWDTAAIFYRLHIRRYYDRRRRELAAANTPSARGS
jgi:glycosyltransferase involved in cell wall biosynthesis